MVLYTKSFSYRRWSSLTHLLSLPLRLNWEGNTNVRTFIIIIIVTLPHWVCFKYWVLGSIYEIRHPSWWTQEWKKIENESQIAHINFKVGPNRQTVVTFMPIRTAQPQNWGTESFSGWVRQIKGIKLKQKKNNNNS